MFLLFVVDIATVNKVESSVDQHICLYLFIKCSYNRIAAVFSIE